MTAGSGSSPVAIRRGTPEDAEPCHQLLWEAATDLGRRHGTPLEGTVADWWLPFASLHHFLARAAAEWWVAEDGQGRLIGYARSIERGNHLELTELFVRPGQQSRGVGRALMERAFPTGRGEVRVIIATTDVRALARYHAAGTVARFPIYTIVREPQDAEPNHLTALALDTGATHLADVNEIERAVLGQPRTAAELAWLVQDREGYLYRRGSRMVGFAFVGKHAAGPVAALEPGDLPDILLHVEGRARTLGLERVELEVPALNTAAIDHLLSRGFRFDPWINLLMSNKPFGQFDRFIGFSPPIFL